MCRITCSTNPNEKDVPDHMLVMTLAHNGTGGDLEFYWNPDTEGEYVLVIFSLTPTELSERESSEPILSVSIQAVDE
jgi:hypothetical protein